MTRQTTSILLIVSLVFNIAVLAVFVLHLVEGRRMMHQGPPPMPEERREMMKEHFNEVRPLQKEFQKSRKDFFEELSKEEFNQILVLEKMEISINNQIAMERKLGERVIKMRENLSAEEFRKTIFNNQFAPKFNEKVRQNRRVKETRK